MRIPIYQVDAFADEPFSGNPAAVCPLESWLPDERMQAIAAENNLSETAFFVAEGEAYALRWFTPGSEVDLCGHATLAAAHVIFEFLAPSRAKVEFRTKSGLLTVERAGELLALDFPAQPARACQVPDGLLPALGREPGEVLANDRDYLVVFGSESCVRALEPDFRALAQLDRMAVCVTAPGEMRDGPDFVSRFFAPGVGIDEDPVTGSAHCMLVPYWSERLQKTKLDARQVSARGGRLVCEARGDRVRIAGKARTYLEGTILI